MCRVSVRCCVFVCSALVRLLCSKAVAVGLLCRRFLIAEHRTTVNKRNRDFSPIILAGQIIAATG